MEWPAPRSFRIRNTFARQAKFDPGAQQPGKMELGTVAAAGEIASGGARLRTPVGHRPGQPSTENRFRRRTRQFQKYGRKASFRADGRLWKCGSGCSRALATAS